MSIKYMRVAAVNAFVQALSGSMFAELTGLPRADREGYDYFGHFARAAASVPADPDFIPDLDLDVNFFSEGPCATREDTSYCSYDPEIPHDRYPLGDKDIVAAKRVIEAYLASGSPSYPDSEAAIRSAVPEYE